MISEINITANLPFLKQSRWENIPKFAVITGINGSGKTQLLEHISKHYNINDSFIRDNQSLESLHFESGPNIQSLEDLNSKLLQDFKKNKNYIRNEKIQILEDLGHPKNPLDQDILEKINFKLQLKNDGYRFNYNTYNLIKIYHEKVNSLIFKYAKNKKIIITEEECHKIIGFPPPWDSINKLLLKHNFKYTIKPPIDGLPYQLCFIDKEYNEVPLKSLSSGEKAIITLILWSANLKMELTNSVILLDEIDAHINPAISEILIDTIKNHLVKKMGIQVIMTTHSPSTVAFIDDEDLFWMEDGNAPARKSKQEVISILSNGLMTYREATGILESVLNKKSDLIVFTEGKTDIAHIKSAQSALNIPYKFDLIDGEGAEKLGAFLANSPPSLFLNCKVIAIFDWDDAGQKQFKKFEQIQDQKNIKRHKTLPNIYTIMLPTPREEFKSYNFCPVEFLYSKEILEQNNMIQKREIQDINRYRGRSPFNSDDFNKQDELFFYYLNPRADKVQFAEKSSSFPEEAFTNFKALFEAIEWIKNQP